MDGLRAEAREIGRIESVLRGKDESSFSTIVGDPSLFGR
jgi:hypothetical protein